MLMHLWSTYVCFTILSFLGWLWKIHTVKEISDPMRTRYMNIYSEKKKPLVIREF